MVILAVRLDDSFIYLDDIKRTNPTKYLNKKKDLDVMDWQHSVIFKKDRKGQKKFRKDKGLKNKKKGKCYNCSKKSYFAADYYFKKNSTIIPKLKEEAKKLKLKDKEKEKATINTMTRT
jgi:hypothetical protein